MSYYMAIGECGGCGQPHVYEWGQIKMRNEWAELSICGHEAPMVETEPIRSRLVAMSGLADPDPLTWRSHKSGFYWYPTFDRMAADAMRLSVEDCPALNQPSADILVNDSDDTTTIGLFPESNGQ